MPDPNIEKLTKQTYLKMIEDSVGSRLFNSLFVRFKDTGEVADICGDGEWSCARFVTGVLLLNGLLDGLHTTIKTTRESLVRVGWEPVSIEARAPGDIIFWEEWAFPNDTMHRHIGFVISQDEAVSTDYMTKQVERHHVTFGVNEEGKPKRKITEILHLEIPA